LARSTASARWCSNAPPPVSTSAPRKIANAVAAAAADAALYVDEVDVAEMRDALIKIQQPDIRSELVRKGLENVKRFSWKETGMKLVSAIQEILEDIDGIPLNPSDPLDTPGRLIYTISKCPGWKQVYPAMLNLERVYTKSREYNQYHDEKDESVVADMDSEIFIFSRSLSLRKNSLIYYYYGLALEKGTCWLRRLKPINAIACWQMAYVWRPAYLAADLAQRLGELELAKQLLTDIVLATYPAHAEARNKLRSSTTNKIKNTDSAQKAKNMSGLRRLEKANRHMKRKRLKSPQSSLRRHPLREHPLICPSFL
jgi:hypothetical protein